jgi:hypothetical protein
MITFLQRGRLGNLLSQWAFARLLAERWAYAFDAPRINGFPGTGQAVTGTRILSSLAVWDGQWPNDAFSGRRIDPTELWHAPNAMLTLRGFFQRFELIASKREEITHDWFRLEAPLPRRPAGDFLICLRLTDYAARKGLRVEKELDSLPNSILQEEEIRRLARTVSHRELHIVTDQPDHEILEKLADLGAEIHSGHTLHDFRLIHSFQKVAICQSTFHWWATFLGRAREIYFPPLTRGIWSKGERVAPLGSPIHYGIDLRVPDDPRYVYDW